MNESHQISRRNFASVLGAGAAYAALRPAQSMAAPPLRLVSEPPNTADIVRLSANESAYGPSQMALKAMTDAFSLASRYPGEYEEPLV
jgi:histidinol-phosphate/aromatic aminotransferase/cobyric acid decarboxylase-like protein